MLIVNAIPDERGWSPIRHMVAIAGELFNCEVVTADRSKPSNSAKILSVLRARNRKRAGDDACLLICTAPADLLIVLNIANWRQRFRYMAAWIIDSFWLEHIPRSIRFRNPFDQLFVTSLEDVDRWRAITGVTTTWLSWGTDALKLGQGNAGREWDVTRAGRQPPEWDDDIDAASAAGLLGIKYRGRPDSGNLNSLQNQRLMMNAYGATKFNLAFSNAVNCDPNNHPTREYLTGRWVDALACGSIVAGVAPRSPTASALLWPGATLELGSTRRGEGMHVLATALRQWTPASAAVNHRMALSRLDWRWRFKTLADACGIRAEPLIRELQLLNERIAALAEPPKSH